VQQKEVKAWYIHFMETGNKADRRGGGGDVIWVGIYLATPGRFLDVAKHDLCEARMPDPAVRWSLIMH
jgi:hypothetical protein